MTAHARAIAHATLFPLLALLALSLALGLSGCDGKGGPTQSELGTGEFLGVEQASIPPFLSLVPDAPERVPHSGLRRIEYHVEVAGVPTSLVYLERITADGLGHYEIELDTLVQPAMTQPQREIFEELQRARQGFFFKYRDLRIRDLELFLANYAVRVLTAAPVLANVECVEIEVQRRGIRGARYRLAIDPRTGLVLRAEERDANGQLVASSTFLEFSTSPSMVGVDFFVERYPGTPLATTPLPPGFVPATPQLLPDGYREVSSDLLEVAGDLYVRRVYHDGFENIFFLQRREPAGPPTPMNGETNLRKVRLAQVGAWRVAELVEARGSLFVLAKASEDEVLALLRSTAP